MIIATEKVVGLTFELRVNNGNTDNRLIETAGSDNPFYYLVGQSGLPPAFETALMGMDAGKKFDFTIDMLEAYGPVEQEAIMDIPNAVFTDPSGAFDAENVSIGKFLYLEDEQGDQHRGKVIGLQADTVTMDFNHPLAGFNLHFSGEIVEVRTAEADELAHGHVHGPGGHHH
jgi:FKBP-type peptidyl-prolyl cis-trans isomerase SlyD